MMYALGVFVFFLFVAALIGCILFVCVLIDALTIWWNERHG